MCMEEKKVRKASKYALKPCTVIGKVSSPHSRLGCCPALLGRCFSEAPRAHR